MKQRNVIIGVMGPGKGASKTVMSRAFELGTLIAENEWITLSGGVDVGVMDAVSRGAKKGGGLTVGILPRRESRISKWVDIPIITDIGSARNNINVLSSDVVVACGINVGTASEIALALQQTAGKHVVLLGTSPQCVSFFRTLEPKRLHLARSPRDVITWIRKILDFSA